MCPPLKQQICKLATRRADLLFSNSQCKQGMFKLTVRDHRFSKWGPGTPGGSLGGVPGGPQLNFLLYKST